MAVNQISAHSVRTFEANVLHLVQQRYSKLRGTVTLRGETSMSHQFNVAAAHDTLTAAPFGGNTQGTDKWVDTVVTNTVYNNRVASPTPVYTADTYEWADVTRMLTDPQSTLVHSQAMRLGRKIDDVIIAAATGTAADSYGTGGLTLPAGQQLGGATTAPDFAFVQRIRDAVLRKDIDPSEEVFLVVSPNFVVNLMSDAKATSLDFVNAQKLLGGDNMVQGWMGFTWIVSNRIATPVAGPPAQRYGLVYTRDSIGAKINRDIFTKVAEVPMKNFATMVYSGLDIGAVRIQDDKVFRAHYLETV